MTTSADARATLLARLASLPYAEPAAPVGADAAVLLALSPVPGGADDLELVLVRRPDHMRNHAGQVGLPGGAVEPGDPDPVAAALREAHEEVGLDPAGVRVLGSLPRAYLHVSGYDVLPVVGTWDGQAPLRPNRAEVAAILRPTLRQLADPANHGTVPLERLVGPAGLRGRPAAAASPVFWVDGVVVWGFTAGLLVRFLEALGLPAPPLPPVLGAQLRPQGT
jgi:8-oxo-dGTP pyrophosphatase MutT (NUDIX family)